MMLDTSSGELGRVGLQNGWDKLQWTCTKLEEQRSVIFFVGTRVSPCPNDKLLELATRCDGGHDVGVNRLGSAWRVSGRAGTKWGGLFLASVTWSRPDAERNEDRTKDCWTGM